MTNQPPQYPAAAPQPQPSDQGWGAAPPPPPHTEGFGPAGAPLPPSLQPPKKGGAGKKILGIVGGVVVALVVAGGLAFARGALQEDKTAEAKQGDCIADLPEVAQGEEAEANNANVVDCGSADARYAVVGRVDGVTAAQASGEDSTVCNPYLDAGAESIYYSIPAGGNGYVLCLKRV